MFLLSDSYQVDVLFGLCLAPGKGEVTVRNIHRLILPPTIMEVERVFLFHVECLLDGDNRRVWLVMQASRTHVDMFYSASERQACRSEPGGSEEDQSPVSHCPVQSHQS